MKPKPPKPKLTKREKQALKFHLSLMVPITTTCSWAIRGTKPNPQQVMFL